MRFIIWRADSVRVYERSIDVLHEAKNYFRAVIGRSAQAVHSYHKVLLASAIVMFGFGVFWSIDRLELSRSDIVPSYIFLIAAVLVPISMVYGAINFMVMGRGANLNVPFIRSLKIACVAQLAEFLPVPGGAIVRGGAMIKHGSGAIEATAHVTVNAVLWVACAAIAAGIGLGLTNPIGAAIGAFGVFAVTACTYWLQSTAGWAIALTALALRFAGLGIAGLRVGAAFLAIGISMTFLEIYPFAFATILGSASSITPGGLAIGETLAAAIATLTEIDPSAAFLAIGLNRIIGLFVSGILTAILYLSSSPHLFNNN